MLSDKRKKKTYIYTEVWKDLSYVTFKNNTNKRYLPSRCTTNCVDRFSCTQKREQIKIKTKKTKDKSFIYKINKHLYTFCTSNFSSTKMFTVTNTLLILLFFSILLYDKISDAKLLCSTAHQREYTLCIIVANYYNTIMWPIVSIIIIV